MVRVGIGYGILSGYRQAHKIRKIGEYIELAGSMNNISYYGVTSMIELIKV